MGEIMFQDLDAVSGFGFEGLNLTMENYVSLIMTCELLELVMNYNIMN